MVPVPAVNVPAVPLMKVPPVNNVPAPKKIIWLPVPAEVILPVVETVPVEILITSLRPVVVADIVIVVADTLPAFTLMVFVPPAFGRDIVIAPITESEFVPLIVTAVALAFVPNDNDAHDAATSTVTVTPVLIVTASADVGTAAPPHVAVLLQTPDTDAVLAAPNTSLGSKKMPMKKSINA